LNKQLAVSALAFAAAAPVAAQSSVTVYGLMDIGIVKATGIGAKVDPGDRNRIGFKGVEDLGGGLSADFRLEHSFNPDTGTPFSANAFWHGASYVGLQNQLGHLRLGRWFAPAGGDVAYMTDPFEARTVAAISRAANGEPDWSTVDVTPVRFSRAVHYESPSMAGFVVKAAYGLPGAASTFHQTSVSAEYTSGSLYLGLGSERVDATSRFVVGAVNYEIGPVKLFGGYTKGKNAGIDARDITLGARLIVGEVGAVRAVYAKLDSDNDASDRRKVGIGYQYTLSKRTFLYTDAARVSPHTGASTDLFDAGISHRF
jgi:predicted porin